LRKENIDAQDIGDLADYLSAMFNLLPSKEQERFLALLEQFDPEHRSFEFLVSSINLTGRSVDTKSDFRHSNGPDLVPEASLKEFQGLLSSVMKLHSGDSRFDRLEAEVVAEVSENSDKRRTMHWSMQLFLELRQRSTQIARQVPGFWQFQVGFLNPISEGNRFGVIVLALGDGPPEPVFLESIITSEREFPVIVRHISMTEHALPTMHPLTGTVACWAKSRKNTSASKLGVLTVKHVVDARIGARVKFNGGVGRVVDIAPEGIDAALVSTPEPFNDRRPTKPLEALVAVAPWTDVEFMGVESGLTRTLVTSTGDQFGILNSYLIPVRLGLADHGRNGDSGALVMESGARSANKAVGLYMAMYTDKAGRPGGLAQQMEQVVEIMDMELYR